jgi:chromosome segregation ATPase
MNRQRNIAATLAVSLSLVAGGAQAQVSTDELAALRAQLAALQERLAALEAAQQSQASQLEEVTTANADQQESIDQGCPRAWRECELRLACALAVAR